MTRKQFCTNSIRNIETQNIIFINLFSIREKEMIQIIASFKANLKKIIHEIPHTFLYILIYEMNHSKLERLN